MIRDPVVILRLVAAVVLLLIGSGSVSGQSAGDFVGRWANVTLNEQPSSRQGCRYAEVVIRIYNLASGFNGKLQGFYSRQLERLLLWAPGCEFEDTPMQPGEYGRIDSWVLYGTPQGLNRMQIVGYHDNCSGSCNDTIDTAEEFKTILTKDGGRLIDLEDSASKEDILVFKPAQDMERDARQAAESLHGLIQPLLEGHCHEFFRDSLDATVQRILPQEPYCQLGAQLSTLMPTVLYDEPLSAYSITLGSLSPPAANPLLLGGGDVFVTRLFVVNGHGGGIPISAILRKQPNGTWKILTITP